MNKSNKQRKVEDVDTEAMKRARQSVVEQELSARSWKAWYEKMFFSMECEKIEPLYAEYQQRVKERMEKETAEYKSLENKLQEAVNADGKEDIKIEPILTSVPIDSEPENVHSAGYQGGI